MFPVDARQEAALTDPVFMLKLYKRVAYGLVPRAEPGRPRSLLRTFLSVDRRCVASKDVPVDPRGVVADVSPIFPPSMLAHQDVGLLLHVLPLEEPSVGTSDSELDGGVRLGDVLLALRLLIPFHTRQVSEIVGAVRATVAKSDVMSPFEEHVTDLLDWESNKRRQSIEAPPPALTQHEAVCFFEEVCGLSSSQSQAFLKYVLCQPSEEADAAAAGAPAYDVHLLHQLLFSEEVPAVAEYPLLMGRFAEACLDSGEPEVQPTGSLALHSSLTSMELTYPASAQQAPLDLDFGSLTRAALSPRQFFYLCTIMQTGFQQRESDQLFYYLKKEHHSSEGVLVSDLIAAFRQYFPPVTMSVLQLVHAATASLLRRGARDSLVFVNLYTSLEEWGASRVPIQAFVGAFRNAGVPDGLTGVLDVELEWLRLKAPTRVDLLLMLCTPVPASRTAVIQKLFQRLDTANEGRIHGGTYLQRFQPERIEGAPVRRQVAQWKMALEAYVGELHEEALEYELFAYFWYMVSAGVDDDPTFTLAIWQSFGLADDGPRRRTR
ncbi:hypothetical protein ABB37_06272 [Leptomonas pyrrhocoris]|uniref:EF-hand domain-containing protein n=1 Tax=Leptomonas pyrrhocoris TaxID=157538 RepID=A0A0N0DUC4_LEPPY|nr:hypothetical protein ABB37_06272 [Leptomonas pyrrhocoris]KPA78672.1 hypothetical protein ABB37_06272 [Leptomonas pyrrhocoris]|eukprot:XP_015657111.1 hypothetical protein ABB37_06272 [Leptomonas pyrrhocoris]